MGDLASKKLGPERRSKFGQCLEFLEPARAFKQRLKASEEGRCSIAVARIHSSDSDEAAIKRW